MSIKKKRKRVKISSKKGKEKGGELTYPSTHEVRKNATRMELLPKPMFCFKSIMSIFVWSLVKIYFKCYIFENIRLIRKSK